MATSSGFYVPTGTEASPLASNTPAGGGGGGSWGDSKAVSPYIGPAKGLTVPTTPTVAPVTPLPTTAPPTTPTTPPAVVTAKPAIKQAQTQVAAVTQKETEAATQKANADAAAKAKEAADLQAKNAADAASAAQGGMSAQAQKDKMWAMQNKTAEQEAAKTATAEATQTSQFYDEASKTWKSGTQPSVLAPPSQKTPESAFIDSVKANDAENKNIENYFLDTANQIQNGTYPLTADQQAQLDDIKNRFTGLIQQQKSSNAAYENSIRIAGISAGRNIYAPEIELGNVQQAINTGLSKIADLNTQMSQSLVAARNAIKAENWEALDKTYAAMNKYQEQHQQAMNDTYNATKEAMKTAREDYDTMKQDMADMAAVAKDPTTIPDSTYAVMDKQRAALGLATYDGYSKELYQLQYDQGKAKAEAASTEIETKRATDMISMFDKLGVSGQVEVGGVKYNYQGYNAADVASGTETDKTGQVKYWTFNKRTGVSESYDLGIMKSEDGWELKEMGDGKFWYVNAKTQQSKPAYASDGQKTWDTGLLATGSTGPCLPGHEANAGQCGAFVNWAYGKGVIGNSLNEKLAALAPHQVSADAVQAGMTFVQAIGGKTGHIGFVESVGVDQTNGREYITVLDSNYHSDGKIEHGRKIYMDDPTLKMISDYPAPNLPQLGSDTSNSPEQLSSAASNKALTASEIKTYQDLGYDVKPGMTQGDLDNMEKKPTEVSSLKTDALTGAKELLDRFNKGQGTSAVGFSRVLGWQMIPGTAPKDFEVRFNNLKSLLSLENVKLLKGQGQVSDAERKLLAEASSKLDLAQSEGDFQLALQDVITALSGPGETPQKGATQEVEGTTYTFDGTNWVSE